MGWIRAQGFARLWLCLVILFAGLELTSPAGALPANLRATDFETTDPSDFGSDPADEDGDTDETASEPLTKLLRESHSPLSHVRLRESAKHSDHRTRALHAAWQPSSRAPGSARPFSVPPPLIRLLI